MAISNLFSLFCCIILMLRMYIKPITCHFFVVHVLCIYNFTHHLYYYITYFASFIFIRNERQLCNEELELLKDKRLERDLYLKRKQHQKMYHMFLSQVFLLWNGTSLLRVYALLYRKKKQNKKWVMRKIEYTPECQMLSLVKCAIKCLFFVTKINVEMWKKETNKHIWKAIILYLCSHTHTLIYTINVFGNRIWYDSYIFIGYKDIHINTIQCQTP